MAVRVVQQVDEHAAQVLGVEAHTQRAIADLGAQAAVGPHGQLHRARPLRRCLAHGGAGVDGTRQRIGTGRNLHDIVDQTLEPLDVVGHHGRQALLVGRQGVFHHQRVGLRNRGQRVADLVRDAGRDTAHRGQLLLPDAGLQRAQVFQQQHGGGLGVEVLVGLVGIVRFWGTLGGAAPHEAHAHAQRAHMAVAKDQRHILAGLGPTAILQRLLSRLQQGAPGGRAVEHEGRGRAQALVDQQRTGRRVGRTHEQAAIDHQHAVGHLLDHQAVQLRLLARQLQAATRGRFFARQARRQFTGQQGDHEQAHAGQARLQHRARPFDAQRRTPGRQQQHQRHRRGGAQRQQARGQHAGHQHRQHEQRRVVEGTAHLQQVQRGESDEVHPDGGQPLPAALLRFGLRQRQRSKARQQPQGDGLHRVGQRHQDQPFRCAHATETAERVHAHQTHADGSARRRIGAVHTHKRIVARTREAALLAVQEAAVTRQRGRRQPPGIKGRIASASGVVAAAATGATPVVAAAVTAPAIGFAGFHVPCSAPRPAPCPAQT